MGREQEMAVGEYNVLIRVGKWEFWDGEKWVGDYYDAKKYKCGDEKIFEEAEQERDRLRSLGQLCSIFYVPPDRKRKT
jgi:hypothetical protein